VLSEFFSADQIEASARRTKFVQRTSKMTGKLFLALVTFGRWSAPPTTVPQLVVKAAQLDVPVEVTPEAVQQRMTARAVGKRSMKDVIDGNDRGRSVGDGLRSAVSTDEA
jgi:hypothetical protein